MGRRQASDQVIRCANTHRSVRIRYATHTADREPAIENLQQACKFLGDRERDLGTPCALTSSRFQAQALSPGFSIARAGRGPLKRSVVMIDLYPHAPAPGHLGFQGRKPFPRPCAWIIVKTIDRDEQLMVDPRVSTLRKNKIWAGARRIVLVSFVVLLALLVLCFLGLIFFGGLSQFRL
jgi:hypothetical protein